jgi:hypothetical protein
LRMPSAVTSMLHPSQADGKCQIHVPYSCAIGIIHLTGLGVPD